MSSIDIARNAILAELEPLESTYAETRAKLELIERAKQQLEAALKALTPQKGSRSRANQGGPKPCACKADVHAVCHAFVKTNPLIFKDELAALAKDKLANELGFSLSGFGLRFAEVLGTDEFTIDDQGRITVTGGGDSQVRSTIALPA